MNFESISELIKERRSIFPKQYIDKEIEDDQIMKILENANWAPTHRKTEPWRFKIFKGEGLVKLSDYLGLRYKELNPGDKFSEFKYKKTIKKPLQCGAVIGICMQRDPEESIPEWEEVAAVACAVQNMWLTCTSLGIGAYWSSPKTITGQNQLMNLAEGESCLGLFYMGYWQGETISSERGSIDQKVQWIKD